jgi:hypothetical protein
MFLTRVKPRVPYVEPELLTLPDHLSSPSSDMEIVFDMNTQHVINFDKKSLKIPKGQSEFVYRRGTDNTMAKRKSTKEQTTIYKTYTCN